MAQVAELFADGRQRRPDQATDEQKTLLQRLGLTLPRRLKRLDNPTQME